MLSGHANEASKKEICTKGSSRHGGAATNREQRRNGFTRLRGTRSSRFPTTPLHVVGVRCLANTAETLIQTIPKPKRDTPASSHRRRDQKTGAKRRSSKLDDLVRAVPGTDELQKFHSLFGTTTPPRAPKTDYRAPD